MSNHKRGRPKNSRSGCLMCKPNKANGANKDILGHAGFGKIRAAASARQDMALSRFDEAPIQ
jgi:hypothetical protein